MGEKPLANEQQSVRDSCDRAAYRERESILKTGGKPPSQDQLARTYREAVSNGDKRTERK